MLKPTHNNMVSKFKDIYINAFSGGTPVKAPVSKQGNKKSITESDPSEKVLINWSPKDFVNYFAVLYKTNFDIGYNISYGSDLKIINQIAKYFKSIGLDYRFNLKNLIDWSFNNKDMIIERSEFLTLITIRSFLNEYIQSVILEIKQQESTESYDFIGELDEFYKDGKMFTALKRYGIPIVATYLHFIKKHPHKTILANMQSMKSEQDDWMRIAKTSIVRSPYLEDMLCLDWRKLFENKVQEFYNENWWRDVDYIGYPHISYKDLLGK
jgi:hypothetical protein